ncbi:PTS sugar transporter subunit IIA [Croceicoccus sp. F390]|uniref:PTS sugar transporter subunit IIA n=1 Tax=Croceicoccus esteveae TaxID=3075597 RepID=A0ABU2ZHY8_9SPHN|nr:PTS sugar transporter subunit IIA [Croceicoccus sp. F390]MDT0576215.1 PTS sugar transporter subunit IIA [Croceicoccus sp. F390]
MTPPFQIDPAAVAACSATTKAQILSDLANCFASAYHVDAAQVLAGLVEREELGSTGFGRGIAIPHARLAGTDRAIGAILRLKTPVPFDAADQLPVELVVGLLSPCHSGADHLHALAAISRLLRDDAMRERLLSAPDNQAVYALLIGGNDRDAA